MGETEEIAKAIQETAKLGTKGLETAEKAAGFFARVFKAPAEEILGMLTDKLRFVRWKRLVQMSEKVDEILKEKGVTHTRAVPPKIALPILEDASLEDDPDLRSLWNHLLANAMNPNFNNSIRYGFIDMIKGITGKEAKLLNEFYAVLNREERIRPFTKLSVYSVSKEDFMKTLNLSADDYAVAANNLMRLQLIAPAVLKAGGLRIGSEPVTTYKGIDAVTLTPLGALFVEACIQ